MTRVIDQSRRSVRQELDTIGFVPIASKLYQPAPGIVSRSTLLARVQEREADVVAVTAPAGYGKSTFMAELAAQDPRPVAWISLSPSENDPATFLTYVALALDGLEPVDGSCVTALWRRSPTLGTAAVARFVGMLADRRPFMLVLDDVQELPRPDVLDLLPVLVSELPPGSTLMLGSRSAMPLPVGRLRVKRRFVEVGPPDLAFDTEEAATLLGKLGLDATN